MRITPDRTLAPLLDKLKSRLALTPQDENAILAHLYVKREMRADDFIVREGETPSRACVLLDGFAYDTRSLAMADGKSCRST